MRKQRLWLATPAAATLIYFSGNKMARSNWRFPFFLLILSETDLRNKAKKKKTKDAHVNDEHDSC